jgi:hypothetical protein
MGKVGQAEEMAGHCRPVEGRYRPQSYCDRARFRGVYVDWPAWR